MKKLKLSELTVKSFITDEEKAIVIGGQNSLLCLTGNYPTQQHSCLGGCETYPECAPK